MTIKTSRTLLNVADIEKSLLFWRDLLGFAEEQRFDSGGRPVFVSLRSGDAHVMLNAHGGDPAARRARPHYTEAVLYFGVDSVHALASELRGKGQDVPEPESQSYGLDEFVLRDPDGYEIAFTSPTRDEQKKRLEDELDEAIEESFPASDPPATGQFVSK
jgi:catechol 2,3-dioxygenase-like lactoylglutathione lyase family enzyme